MNRQKFLADELAMTEIKNITKSTTTRRNILVMSRLLQKQEILLSRQTQHRFFSEELTITEQRHVSRKSFKKNI